VISNNTLYFKPIKNILLPYPEVKYDIVQVDGGYEIALSTSKLAKNLYLTIGDFDGFFSDNYFDLLPGQTVNIKLETQITRDELVRNLAIRTLDRAF
jgi:beta-mannosidase